MFGSEGDGGYFGHGTPSMAGPHLRGQEQPAPSKTAAKPSAKGKRKQKRQGKRRAPRHIEFNESFSSSSVSSVDSMTLSGSSSSFDDYSSSDLSDDEDSFLREAERESLVHPPQHHYEHSKNLDESPHNMRN